MPRSKGIGVGWVERSATQHNRWVTMTNIFIYLVYMMSDKKLFAIYLGGHAKQCNIEVHDVVFAIASNLQDTFPTLEKKWFGIRKGLHIDAWIELNYVDGYQIQIVPAELSNNESDLKLYFINFGAYEPNFFGEVHQSGFYIASDKKAAQAQARKELCLKLQKRHHDDTVAIAQACRRHIADSISDIDDCVEVATVDSWRLVFTPTDVRQQLRPNCEYIKLPKQLVISNILLEN